LSNIYKTLFKKPQQTQVEPLSKTFKFKTKFAMVGTIGSGKTTVSTLMVLTSQTLSNMLPNFTCRTLPGSTNIIDYVSKMRTGHFPPKTDATSPERHEDGLLCRWAARFAGSKQVNIPICDLAGEKLQSMIQTLAHRRRDPTSQEAYNISSSLINYVRDCEGYILIAPASRAMAFQDGVQLEKETEDEELSGISVDPDANLYNFVQDIIAYKENCKGKPIKAIAVVVTKWDKLMPYAQEMGIDLDDTTGQGIQAFMETFFPQTTSLLKFEKDRPGSSLELRFFPSYVKVAKDSQGKPQRWPDGHDKIEMEPNLRIPKYWAQSYVDLINYLGTFAS
jgi:hypothetical protein